MKELVAEHTDKGEWPELWRSSEEINREEEKSRLWWESGKDSYDTYWDYFLVKHIYTDISVLDMRTFTFHNPNNRNTTQQ